MRLTKDEMAHSKDEHPPELFRQGMRATETRDKYERTLHVITCIYVNPACGPDHILRLTCQLGVRLRYS